MVKTYIYGENYIKTRKNLYCINSYNYYNENKIVFDFYIKVDGYSNQNGRTNSFTSFDGNHHITEFRESSYNKKTILFNRISETSKLYNAIKKRIGV